MKIFSVIVQCDDDTRIDMSFDDNDIADVYADKLRKIHEDMKIFVEESQLLRSK